MGYYRVPIREAVGDVVCMYTHVHYMLPNAPPQRQGISPDGGVHHVCITSPNGPIRWSNRGDGLIRSWYSGLRAPYLGYHVMRY